MAFNELDSESSPLNNEQQFIWLMQAYERLNLVLETIDDSGGYRLDLERELGSRLIPCFHRLDWSVEKKAKWLQEHRSKYIVFPWIPDHFGLDTELAEAYAKLAGADTGSDSISFALMDKLNQGKLD